ncbi:MAG TPA: hypothetical protein VGL61_14900, partial [Kofleriaceae bacterium]
MLVLVHDSASSESALLHLHGPAGRVSGDPDDLVAESVRFDLVRRELRANVIFERKQDRGRAR